MPRHVEHIDSATALWISRICQATKPKRMADRNLRQVQSWYQREDDKKVLFELTFDGENYVFVERPPLTTAVPE